MKTLALAAMLCVASLSALAKEAEAPNACTIYGPNVCETASLMESSMKQTLPLAVSNMIIMEQVTAKQNELLVTMRVHGADASKLRQGIESAKDNGVALKTATQDSIFSNSCAGNQTHEFISNGGKVTYQFLYEDDVQLMSFSIMSCTQPLGEAV